MKKKSLGEVFIGLAVVAVGAGLFADALGLLHFGKLVSTWWPLAVIGVGVVSLLSNPRVWWWPSVVIIVGFLFLLNRLGVVDVNAARLIWPSIIVMVGLGILFERGARGRDIKDDEVNSFVAFSGSDTRSTSQEFKGGKVTALFGGIVLDLNDAKLTKDGAQIDAFVFAGGVELRAPEGWLVKVDGLPIMGGWENKTKVPQDASKAPTLTVRTTCIMGGLSIKNGRSND
ncbi:MAG TPA: DUF5668 domain-containing protein [Candidatus Saccharimonadales bacterium]|nr:DUF5668 domain-containing protein [Candidatus Saccharimonadales bacterium]